MQITRTTSDMEGQWQPGWVAALSELEHQAEHWKTPEHGLFGQLVAQALCAAVDIARQGGLRCEHRPD